MAGEMLQLNDHADGGHVDSFEPGRRCVQPGAHGALGDRVREVVRDVLVRCPGFETRPGKEPVDVGVPERQREAAGLAAVTRRAVGVWCRANERLRDPECQALLADAARPVKQEARGKGTALSRRRQALTQRIVTVQRNDRHERKMVGASSHDQSLSARIVS